MITDETVEQALTEWRKIIRLEFVLSEPAEDSIQEISSVRVIKCTEAPAMRAALEAVLGRKEER
jgi:hypothetical protein